MTDDTNTTPETSDGAVKVLTMNSLYEIDMSQRRVRRVASTHEPTGHQADTDVTEDGWKQFHSVGWCEAGLMFVWRVDRVDRVTEGAIVRRTWTSPVVEVVGDFPAPPQPLLN